MCVRNVLPLVHRHTVLNDQTVSSAVKDGHSQTSTENREAHWRDTGIRLADGEEENEDAGKSEASSSAKKKKGKKERIAERRAREKSENIFQFGVWCSVMRHVPDQQQYAHDCLSQEVIGIKDPIKYFDHGASGTMLMSPGVA